MGRIDCCSAREWRADRRDKLLKRCDTAGRVRGVVTEPLPSVAVGMRIAAHPPRRSGRGLSTIRLLPRVIDGKPPVRPWVTDGGTRPQHFGHALQPLPVEAGSLGPPAQCTHPQALQPAAERTDEPARPWDGKVVEPALVELPKPRADFPDVVMPALAEYLVDACQGPVGPFCDRTAYSSPSSVTKTNVSELLPQSP